MNHARKSWGLDRVVRHESRSAWPLFAGSLVWFGCLTVIWADQHPDPFVRRWCTFALVAIWCVFVIDYSVRLIIAGPDRRRFLRTRGFELASIVIPFLRPFMLLVYIWRLPLFRAGAIGRLRMRFGVVTVLFSFLLVYVSSYLVWAVEKDDPRANIVNFGDAIWWGFVTITTVGYGDYAPVTVLGRTFAMALMVGGVVVLGVTTATLISAISEQLKRVAIPADADADADAASKRTSTVANTRREG